MTSRDERATRRRDRLIALLGDAEAIVDGGPPPVLRLLGSEGLRRLRVDPDLLAALAAEGVIRIEAAAGGDRVILTAAGHALRGGFGVDRFRAAHGDVVRRAVEPAGPAVLVDEAESPLGRLARRRDRDGRALLAPARIAAGERLRRDFTLARMMPTVTSNWSIGRTGGGPPGGPGDLTDRALAARDRVHAALDTVGRGDLADVLLDVCCFLQGLETVESLRHWPARSAKVVLDIALGRLAVHYGLAEEARGRDGPGRTRRWGAADYRPSVGGGTAAGRD